MEYSPTGDMVADYLTKPLQGSLFKKFWDFMMNGDPSSTLHARLEDHRSVLEPAPNSTSERLEGPNSTSERLEGQTWTVVGHE